MVTSSFVLKYVISIKSAKYGTIIVLTVSIEGDCIKARFCMKCIHINVITLIIVINCSKYTLEYNQRLTKILDFSQIYTWVYLNTYFRSFLYSLINCEQFRTEKPARKAFFL